MDLTVGVTALPARELIHSCGGESSAEIRARVIAARERQMARDGRLNARLQGRRLRARTTLDARGAQDVRHRADEDSRSRPEATTACCVSRGRSLTWMARSRSAPIISPRRCSFAGGSPSTHSVRSGQAVTQPSLNPSTAEKRRKRKSH